jgi:hypothetical protein
MQTADLSSSGQWQIWEPGEVGGVCFGDLLLLGEAGGMDE